MKLTALGWARTVRGLREGDQALLLTGLALVLVSRLRASGKRRRLVYRKTVPVGSTVVVRHTRRGMPRLHIHER